MIREQEAVASRFGCVSGRVNNQRTRHRWCRAVTLAACRRRFCAPQVAPKQFGRSAAGWLARIQREPPRRRMHSASVGLFALIRYIPQLQSHLTSAPSASVANPRPCHGIPVTQAISAAGLAPSVMVAWTVPHRLWGEHFACDRMMFASRLSVWEPTLRSGVWLDGRSHTHNGPPSARKVEQPVRMTDSAVTEDDVHRHFDRGIHARKVD